MNEFLIPEPKARPSIIERVSRTDHQLYGSGRFRSFMMLSRKIGSNVLPRVYTLSTLLASRTRSLKKSAISFSGRSVSDSLSNSRASDVCDAHQSIVDFWILRL